VASSGRWAGARADGAWVEGWPKEGSCGWGTVLEIIGNWLQLAGIDGQRLQASTKLQGKHQHIEQSNRGVLEGIMIAGDTLGGLRRCSWVNGLLCGDGVVPTVP